MITRRSPRRAAPMLACILSLAVVLLVGVAAQGKAAARELKILKGTWTCPICDSKGLTGKMEECEDLGHKHVLKLDGGVYITFVENARSVDLIKGGGRHNVRMAVCGLYDPDKKMIDVDGYEIDGIWSTWCDAHTRMDMCRSHATQEEEGGSAKTAN